MKSGKRIALVTGASGGIGAAIVSLFLENAWEVIGVDRSPSQEKRAAFIQADLAEIREVDQLSAAVRNNHSRLDAIVNNAAELTLKALREITPAEWDHTMASNVRPIYLLMARLHELLSVAGGAVVNVASVHAVATSPGMAAYVASKGAVVALTRAMAVEFASSGIRVNAVLPGAIDTPMLAAGLNRSNLDRSSKGAASAINVLAARHPMGRIGKPKEVAEAIYFLADNARSSFITGQTLTVDGGATALLSTE